MADPSGEDGDLRLEEDDILDGGSDLATSGDHMSEDPVRKVTVFANVS